jgi:hypothetical protein
MADKIASVACNHDGTTIVDMPEENVKNFRGQPKREVKGNESPAGID